MLILLLYTAKMLTALTVPLSIYEEPKVLHPHALKTQEASIKLEAYSLNYFSFPEEMHKPLIQFRIHYYMLGHTVSIDEVSTLKNVN